LISVLAALEAAEVGRQQRVDRIEKVAEEMLLCEVIVQYSMPKAPDKRSAYEGAVQQDCEKLLSLCAAAADRLRYSSVYV
jgi:hypothetical protein